MRALRRAAVAVVAATGVVLGLAACAGGQSPAPSGTSEKSEATQSLHRSGDKDYTTGVLGLRRHHGDRTPYLSGIWVGEHLSPNSWQGFGDWRGVPVDAVLGYTDDTSWEGMKAGGNIALFREFPGTLVYGVGIVPKVPGIDSATALAEVARGDHDEVWRAIGDALATQGRQRSIVRVGLEANGTWFPWGAKADTAEVFKAAFRRVVMVLRQTQADAVIDFDIGCGVGLSGDPDPMAPLTKLYPGDDVVDLIGCDIYDSKDHVGGNPMAAEQRSKGPTLEQALAFAKAHNKPFTIPEWGLDHIYGNGDNPDFIKAMYAFIDKNARDIALEMYFSHKEGVKSSIWRSEENPRAAAAYRDIWQSRPAPGT